MKRLVEFKGSELYLITKRKEVRQLFKSNAIAFRELFGVNQRLNNDKGNDYEIH